MNEIIECKIHGLAPEFKRPRKPEFESNGCAICYEMRLEKAESDLFYAKEARDKAEAEVVAMTSRLAVMREALERITHYTECLVKAFGSGNPYLDMTLLPSLISDARKALTPESGK